MEYDRTDKFSFDNEPKGNPFSQKKNSFDHENHLFAAIVDRNEKYKFSCIFQIHLYLLWQKFGQRSGRWKEVVPPRRRWAAWTFRPPSERREPLGTMCRTHIEIFPEFSCIRMFFCLVFDNYTIVLAPNRILLGAKINRRKYMQNFPIRHRI